MNVLLIPLGSHGDVHPFIGIALALGARGHRVRMIANPFFAPLIEKAGLEQVPLGTAEEYRQLAGDPELWKPLTGLRMVFRSLGQFVVRAYEAIVANQVPGDTVVVASSLALGARIAQDRHQIPTVSVHLQPSMFRSLTDPPALFGFLSAPWVPHRLMRWQWAIGDRLVIDPLAGPPINALRKELGLPKVTHIFRDYVHSPQMTIGLFPAWFAAPQADWPPQVRLTGFPLYDERGVTPLSPELLKFLDEGPPPIAFTFGSAMWHARDLLEQSARACTLLDRRGILLTRHRDHLPARLPPGVKHFDFAPFSELLPRCSALVHHGGIGTASQALATGLPQLVLPHAHDQLDNATRLTRLGVAALMMPRKYQADRAAQALADLIASPRIAKACRDVAAQLHRVDAMAKTCELIEGLLPAAGKPGR